jgi:ATP-dependent DNA ligase
VNASAHLGWEGILGNVLPDVRPMLAGTGLPTTTLDDWAVEPKLDGWRVDWAARTEE